jgi:predicted O-methyltransferase YrrM
MRKYRKSLFKFSKKIYTGNVFWAIFVFMNAIRYLISFLIHRLTALSGYTADSYPAELSHFIPDNFSEYDDFKRIESQRNILLNDTTPVTAIDVGAGSRKTGSNRTVGGITRVASVNARFGRLLYRLVRYYKPSRIIELGTATGISTLYLAMGNPRAEVISIEGNPQLAEVAIRNISSAGVSNIRVMNSTFDNVIQQLASELTSDSLVFIDGNHTAEATWYYFTILARSGKNPVLIFDDINWSAGMRSTWNKICQQTHHGIIIDLFFMGIYLGNSSVPFQFLRINY